MAESLSSTRKSNHLQKLLTESDMAAAQQLMQLSDEDSYNSSKKKRVDVDADDDGEVDQSRSEITSAVIEKLFGKEEAACRPIGKKRRYRSLVSIYTATKPMNGRFEKRVRSYGNLNGVLA